MAEELSRILSGDPLPRIPVEDDPDIDKWRRDVVSYLRRLTGKLTNQIIEDSAGGMMLFEHVDDTFDNHTGNNNETTLKTVTIPANTIVSGTMLAVEAMGRMTTTQLNTDFRIRFRYNGAVFADSQVSGTLGQLRLDNLEQSWHGFALLRFDGVSTTQRGSSHFDAADTGRFLGTDTLSENTTLALDITLTILIQISSQGQTIGCDFFHIKAITTNP